MTDHSDQECESDGDTPSSSDSVSLLPDNTKLNEQTDEEIQAFGLQINSKEEKNEISDSGNGSCIQFSTGCAESPSQSGDKSSNYQSSVRPSTSDTANVGSRETDVRAGEPGDVHWRKEDTITDKLCGSKDLAVVLGKADTNQTELSLLGPENAGRYHTLLTQTHNLLAEVLTKQHQEKDDLTLKCQSVSGSFCQSLLNQLSSLTSRQKDLVRLLQRQTELVEAYVTMMNRREQSHTPVTQADLGGLRGITTPGTSPTHINKTSIQTEEETDSRPPQDAPQPTNMSQVTLEDKPLSQYLLNTDTEDNTAQAHSTEELQRANNSSTQTPVTHNLNCPKKIEIIHLVHDDELLPNALMDIYWKNLLGKVKKTGALNKLGEITCADDTIDRWPQSTIIDLGSGNGTHLNNQHTQAQRRYELKENDVLMFGFSTHEDIFLHEVSDTSEVNAI